MTTEQLDLNSRQAEFLGRLRAKRDSYHLEHPFEQKLKRGELSMDQLRGWVANRFYYQLNLPRKDAAILSQCDDPRFRQAWVRRVLEQDGTADDPGGIESWMEFGQVFGLTRSELLGGVYLLPPVKFAVEAYVHFARTSPWREGVCACLTELFAGEAHESRIEAFSLHYPQIPESALSYFKRRTEQVKVDVKEGVKLTLEYFNTPELESRAEEILKFKLDILWTMADAVYNEYVVKENFPWKNS